MLDKPRDPKIAEALQRYLDEAALTIVGDELQITLCPAGDILNCRENNPCIGRTWSLAEVMQDSASELALSAFLTRAATITDDRLADINDGKARAEDWEMPAVCAELLARRAGDRQRETVLAAVISELNATVEFYQQLRGIPRG